MEEFDKRVVQWLIDSKPESVAPKQYRLPKDAYVHVGYGEDEAVDLLRRIVPDMPSEDVTNAAKQAVHLWGSMVSALSNTTPFTETLDKVAVALAEVGQLNAIATLGLCALARDSALREAAIRQAIPNVMRSSGAATKRHGTPEQQDERAQRLRAIWAKGGYRTREVCAYKEHEKLGMTETAAKAALSGTPDPDPWPARERKRN